MKELRIKNLDREIRAERIKNLEREILLDNLLEFMADCAETGFPVHPGALIEDPRGDSITVAAAVRVLRKGKL